LRSLLLTGGTGSFGRAFIAAELARERYDRICVFSRGEHAQAAMRESLKDDSRLRWFIGDVRDRDRLVRAMEGVDDVIHAAALKRIEVGHYNPVEMVKTNVLGAMNVIEAAKDAGVARVVSLSSDKACEPVSAYGLSKALAESLFLASNATVGSAGPLFAVTRYGNVAGSQGSVIPRWRALIEAGKNVPVTDPECTRFWMTMEQAVTLVRIALERMTQPGSFDIRKPIVPELPAYRLADLAMALGAPGIVCIGLPAWEKKHESMVSGSPSNQARRMSIDELREALAHV